MTAATNGALPKDTNQYPASGGYAPNSGTVAIQLGTPTLDTGGQPSAPVIVQFNNSASAPGYMRIEDASTAGNVAGVSAAHLTKNQAVSGFALAVAGFGALTNALGNSDPQIEASFDNQPHAGMPTDAPYYQSVVPGVTVGQAVTANAAAQNVTLSAVSGTLTRGAPWKIQTGSFLSIGGANPEIVYVNSVAGSQVNAIFAKNHSNGDAITVVTFNAAKDASVPNPTGAGTGYSATQLFNNVSSSWEDELSAAGENSGASGSGTAVAAEYEETSGGPPLANGTPSLLRYDREVAALGKAAINAGAGYACTSTTAGDTIITPTTPGNFKTLTPGQWIRLSGAATPEYVRVANTYTVATAPATIPLTSPVVNTGQTTATWDAFGANGPGTNPILLTGEGLEGVILNDSTQAGFGRMWQGDPFGNARVTYYGGTKATYTYAISATAPYATPTDWIVIRGSSTKTVKIARIEISGAATAATEVIFTLQKHTVANTGGTSTNPTPMQHDSADGAATALVLLYSAAPTIAGSATIWKTVRMTLAVAPAATTVAPDRYVYDYAAQPYEPLTLRGVAQELAINFNGAAVPSGGVYDLAITITEE